MGSDVLVLGGGFAGLSCAVALAGRGLRVTLAEKKPHLGGRAYSFTDPETGDCVDNGQHLFLACYRHTRKFLEAVGSSHLLRFSDRARVDYADASGRRDVLSCPTWLPAPWHLAWGVLGLKGLSLRDKWGLVRLRREIGGLTNAGSFPKELDTLTVRQWLSRMGQSSRVQQRLFDPIALGALNDDPEVASALGFAQVLREAFFKDAAGTRLGLSAVGLSELYTEQARAFIERRGGRVLLGARAAEILERGGVVLESGERLGAEAVVSTLAPWDLAKLRLPAALRGPWLGLKASPIVSLTLWLDRPVMEEPLVGLLGTEIQWAFNKSRILGEREGGGQHLALVISGARRQVGLDPKALLRVAERDLSRCFPAFQKATIRRWRVVKEPFATLSPEPGSDALRPGPGPVALGLYLAGDWTRTGLPATIESAVASGHGAAERIVGGRLEPAGRA